MTAALQRCEIWSDYQCNSGTRQVILPVDQIIALTTTERTTHEDDGTLTISKEIASYASLVTGYVLRFLFTDASFTEWRIRTVQDTSRESRLATATLSSPLSELATGAAIMSSTTSLITTVDLEYKGLSPSDVVTAVLAFCPTFWAAGTITPTIPVNLAPSGWMPLQALRELVTAIRAQGVDAELHYRRNGTTGYYIDIVSAIGSAEPALDVRTAKNLLGTSRLQDRDRYALEAVPLGTNNATCARMYFEVTNKSGLTLTVQQPVVAGSMIAFNGQLDGLYLLDDAGARQLISASLAAGTFDVASAANVTSGRWYRIVGDSSGTDLIRVRKAAATAGPVQPIRASTLDATTNYVPNPAMRVWTGGASVAADGWTISGTTKTRTTTAGLWLYGGKSQRIETVAATLTVEPSALSIYVPTWATAVVFSAWAYVVADTSATFGYQPLKDGGVWGSHVAAVAATAGQTFVRTDITISLTGFTGAVHSFALRAETTAIGTSDVYVDAMQITFAAAAAAFTEGSNPSRLWTFANRYLTKYSTIPATYHITFADLGQLDPTSFPYDAVALGQTANVRDTDLGLTVSARVVELRRDWKAPLASSLTVSSRPDDLISLLTGLTT